MTKYINAERIPKDEFFNGLSDAEKAKVIQWFVQAPTENVAPKSETAKEVLKEVRVLLLNMVLANSMGETIDIEAKFAEIEKRWEDCDD